MEKKLVRKGGAGLVSLGLMLGAFGTFAPDAWAHHNENHTQGGGNDNQGGDAQDPGGNNGTVKIREAGTAIEDVSNDPHIDCLEIAWYNFGLSAGATVTLTQVAPTAAPAQAGQTFDVEDDAAGGADDGDGVFLPTFNAVGDAQNGYWHVDVHILTTSANGTQEKNKTVWLKNDCSTDPDPATPAYLRVSKSVVGTPAGDYGFGVSCTGATATPSTFTLADGTSQTVTVSASGASCTVTETNALGAAATTYSVDGGTATAGTAATVTVDGTQAAPDTVAFVNTHTTGGGGAYLRVSKSVVGTPAGDYGFGVSCTGATATPSTFTLAHGTSQTVTVSASGASCTVTETNALGAAATTYSVDGGTATAGTAATVTVDGTQAAPDTVAFTNTHTTAGGEVIVPVVTQAPPAPTAPPAPAAAPGTIVAGVQVQQPAPAAAPAVAPAPAAVQSQVFGTELARTGAMTERLLQLAGALLVLGGLAFVAGSRTEQRTAPTRRR